ncbi:hypothetical protein [Dyadobacter fanqingshengii]|uniref:Uncharacterized protein n=1 Tax=Dyadobacter fanqingshengii TaxID=2906443 RepID=A0A9X1PBI1_9BACT|nr:hypothetical protein [Dyadobacter fanqingshengii]MCF0040227.1 hypothetical protein [Dyadobacter fanqingshengii]USJ38025.1 hypothetical protein NFI81_09600 [Dyadobacter fanqingshengii]
MKIVNSSFIYLGLLVSTILYGCAKNEVADPPLKESSTTKNRFFLTQGEAIKHYSTLNDLKNENFHTNVLYQFNDWLLPAKFGPKGECGEKWK